MREQLRPWLDLPVFMKGTVTQHLQRGGPTSLYDVMLSEVEVRRVDRTRPLLDPNAEVIRLDHLWLIQPQRVYPIGSRLMSMGRPGFYARANGTVDLGVHQIRSVSAEHYMQSVMQGAPDLSRVSALSALEQMLRRFKGAADRDALIHLSDTQSVDQLLTVTAASIARLRRSVEAECNALLSSWLTHQSRLNGQPTTRRERRQAARNPNPLKLLEVQ